MSSNTVESLRELFSRLSVEESPMCSMPDGLFSLLLDFITEASDADLMKAFILIANTEKGDYDSIAHMFL